MKQLILILCSLSAPLAVGQQTPPVATEVVDSHSSPRGFARRSPVLKKAALYRTTPDSLVDVALKAEPDINSKTLFKIGPGAVIEVMERGDVYYRVRADGIEGYVLKYRLTRQ